MWASTHNDTLKEKMNAVLSALSACQEKLGSGYLSAFPSEQFDRFEAIKPVWAPYYTIHKVRVEQSPENCSDLSIINTPKSLPFVLADLGRSI